MLEFVPVSCPWCGEPFEATVDVSVGSTAYVEDCPVCCQPIVHRLQVAADGALDALVLSRDD